ncbi:hypothetical protein [Gillisia sp. CAL575]|uniref:hypothetical protein n=1 Tax=Gillisia sp. CAL575 TaxID=985255 RepID=UPI0003A0F82F|nr:hypothetical protein [Gillisia sp. CAL575]
MQFRIIDSIGFLALLLASIYALFANIFWLDIMSHIGYFIFAFLWFIHKRKFYNFYFYMFLGLTLISYCIGLLSTFWVFGELILLLQAISYLPLIMEATKHFRLKNMSYIMLLYLFSIIGLNTYLLLLHINEMKTYISGDITTTVYTFYYLNLGALGFTAMVYYLNSFSKKSMFFISLAISIIFANVLRDMGVFYFKDISVEISESIIRMGSALFLVLFFITSEKSLKLDDFT